MTTPKEPIPCAGKHLTRADLEQLINDNGGPEGLTLLDADLAKENLTHLDLHGICFGTFSKKSKWVGAANLQGADLLGANLQGADLWYANLQGAYLWGANLQGARLRNAKLQGASLGGANLQGADLLGANLQGASLVRANLQEAYLGGATFDQTTDFEEADWGNYRLGTEDEVTYRRLKQWHSQRGLYDRAGEFFYREMECRRKAAWFGYEPPRWRELIWPPKAWGRLLKTLWPKNRPAFLGYTLMGLTCGYGERPWRAVVTALAFLFGFAAAFSLPGALLPAAEGAALTFWDALAFSGLSFTALGYPSWAPVPTEGWRFLGILEGFLGWLTISLFLVTFTRRMARGG